MGRLLVTRRALLGAGGALALGAPLAFLAAQPAPRVVKVVAKRFEFMPGEIRLARGEPVVLEFTTLDVPMGFNLPDFAIRSDIVPDRTSRVALTPDRTGRFTFVCDIFCGSGHEDMSGTLIVA